MKHKKDNPHKIPDGTNSDSDSDSDNDHIIKE